MTAQREGPLGKAARQRAVKQPRGETTRNARCRHSRTAVSSYARDGTAAGAGPRAAVAGLGAGCYLLRVRLSARLVAPPQHRATGQQCTAAAAPPQAVRRAGTVPAQQAQDARARGTAGLGRRDRFPEETSLARDAAPQSDARDLRRGTLPGGRLLVLCDGVGTMPMTMVCRGGRRPQATARSCWWRSAASPAAACCRSSSSAACSRATQTVRVRCMQPIVCDNQLGRSSADALRRDADPARRGADVPQERTSFAVAARGATAAAAAAAAAGVARGDGIVNTSSRRRTECMPPRRRRGCHQLASAPRLAAPQSAGREQRTRLRVACRRAQERRGCRGARAAG